ncbi:uncharacterized protein J4E88_007129 [Alternaria novae-zelandiae]|uniref:uncharacterized protein n=1 Tax=Alternaria novae-zelandiae TaxID=430562 RepID=UPI0020C1F56B|nr:uncharacterized protein J4E88_007129 [Alternaria novae-zelandiae]KAI4677321.1 hypothetical protein J4E88_007129 [Alternaria novae-zelandiae]
MFFKFPITLLAISSGVMAYTNNCKGSTNSPLIAECRDAIANNINAGLTYSHDQEFSYGTCYVKYATNDKASVSHPVSGQKIKDVATRILNECGHHKGSFGTDNCDGCHVTVNYKAR